MATFTQKHGDGSFAPLNMLNDQFASVVQGTDKNPHAVPSGCNQIDGCQFLPFSTGEVEKAVSSIKTSIAPGDEQFPGFVIKKLAKSLDTNITIIYNSTFIYNLVPKSWKMADIRAIYKQKGSRSDPNIYRPYSVLPLIGCTLEKLYSSNSTLQLL